MQTFEMGEIPPKRALKVFKMSKLRYAQNWNVHFELIKIKMSKLSNKMSAYKEYH